ncbi:MAG: alpha/beta hydrolase, partial [Thermomicrobiales bacterium]
MSGLAIDVQKLLHLPYTTVDGVELLVDILRPTTGQRSGPAIIYVHGGGWAAGHRSDTPNDVLAKHGFTMLSISYRLSGRYLFPAALHDVKAAIRWTKAHANDLRIDPDRLGIWGHSAGGHLASLAALTSEVAELESHRGPQRISSRVQAAVPLAGPSWFPAE